MTNVKTSIKSQIQCKFIISKTYLTVFRGFLSDDEEENAVRTIKQNVTLRWRNILLTGVMNSKTWMIYRRNLGTGWYGLAACGEGLKKVVSAGNRTRAGRVAGEHPTTEYHSCYIMLFC